MMGLSAAYRRIAVGLSSAVALVAGGRSGLETSRSLAMETLEPRLALSALGLVDAPYQPTGGLDGKIVYLHGGHGYTANNLGSGGWGFQRPEFVDTGNGVIDSNMIEDLGNQDQMSLLADYLFRAGATIAALRPIGHQESEVVLDNVDARVTFQGSWSDSSAGIYYGELGEVPYRFASTSPTETAVARYQPDLPEAGFYPVYAWTRYGSDRAADQLYRVHHAGGETEVTVNHRRVGNGLVYLGTYRFEQGTAGYVEISNKSSETGRVVIADMIRFGNGVGDIDRGAGVSGRAREDEAGLYWVKWHVDRSQGISDSEYRATSNDRNATVSLAPRYAEYMNRESDGALRDRVFVSFHSNAGGGSARGVLGLYNGNNDPSAATPNQFLLAKTLAQEVNDDLVAQDGAFEHNWFDRGNNTTLDRGDIEFGEINNLRINNEFDATIIETGYHDNELDIRMLRDPKVRDAIARATYQGLVSYFRQVDGNQTPATVAPAPVTGVWTESTGAGAVTVHWTPPQSSPSAGDAAASYRIFASTNGYAFDGGTVVPGGTASSHTFAGLDPLQTYYFQVVAENAGGASAGSQVMAAKANSSDHNVLIVNGFDRLSRSLNPREPVGAPGNTVDRVRPRESNSGDYVITVADAIQSRASTLAIASASNESVIAGNVDLSQYDAVVWMSGEESSADDTFDATEQTLVEAYIAAGGNLFVSGAEIGWDLDLLNNGRSFFRNTFKATYAADDANTYSATGSPGGLLAGLDLGFDDGQQFYDVNFADVLTPNAGATTIATYAGGGGAATQAVGANGRGDVVLMGFPVESILSKSARDTVVERVLASFGLPTIEALAVDRKIDNSDLEPQFATTGSWSLVNSPQADAGSFLVTNVGSSATATWTFDIAEYGQAELLVRWVSSPATANHAVYRVDTGFGERTMVANQAVDSAQWVSLGNFPVAAGTRQVTLRASEASGGLTVVADAVRLVVNSAVEASGDFTGESQIDLADYTVWRDTLGQTTARGTVADANGDTITDELDYLLWREQVQAAAEPAVASVLAPIDPFDEAPTQFVPYANSSHTESRVAESRAEIDDLATQQDLIHRAWIDATRQALGQLYSDKPQSEESKASSPATGSANLRDAEFRIYLPALGVDSDTVASSKEL